MIKHSSSNVNETFVQSYLEFSNVLKKHKNIIHYIVEHFYLKRFEDLQFNIFKCY